MPNVGDWRMNLVQVWIFSALVITLMLIIFHALTYSRLYIAAYTSFTALAYYFMPSSGAERRKVRNIVIIGSIGAIVSFFVILNSELGIPIPII